MERALVGDIGGTNARFALVELHDGALRLDTPQTYRCREHDSLQAVISTYLDSHGGEKPDCVSIAAAGPVTDGVVAMTNLPWTLSEQELLNAGFARSVVVNDFEALAFGLPDLQPADLDPVGTTPAPSPGQTLAVLGAGTGFGTAALVRRGGRLAPLSSEGPHVSFAPTDELESEVLHYLAARFGRVSVERVLSGPGLVNLYQALAEISGETATCVTPADITTSAMAGDHLARHAVERFCSIYGAVAGDFALAFGARGGVFLAGGIAPQLRQFLNGGGFRRAFEAKGRLGGYMAAIPTAIITHPYLALVGAARALQQ